MKYVVIYARMEIEFTQLRELTEYIRRLPVGAEITVSVKLNTGVNKEYTNNVYRAA